MRVSEDISEGDCWMAIGHENGTNDRVTVYGTSKEEVTRKAYGRAYGLRGVIFYTMPPYSAPRLTKRGTA